MTQEVSIVVDDREARGHVLEALRAMDDVSIRVDRLVAGDYEVDGRLLVERKTLPDLAESIKDGRLFRQAHRLVESPLKSLIILEGSSGSLKSSAMRREAIQGALVTLTVYYGIPLLRSFDPHETVRLMIYAARQGRAIAEGGLQGVRMSITWLVRLPTYEVSIELIRC
jgi:DNA excision repair protein ERCC-4